MFGIPVRESVRDLVRELAKRDDTDATLTRLFAIEAAIELQDRPTRSHTVGIDR